MLCSAYRIIKDGKTAFVLGERYVCGFDNYEWENLVAVLDILSNNSLEDAKKKIDEETNFTVVGDCDYDIQVINLDDKTIDMPYFPVYEPSEVSRDNCCIDMRIDGDKYYAIYDDGDEYEMPHVTFDRVDLLKAKKVNFDEFMLVAKFAIELMGDYGDSDFVLNKELIIRFNCA